MDKREYESIYTEYRRKVLGFVRSKVANPADAGDIVQTVFLKVYSRLEKYDERMASLSQHPLRKRDTDRISPKKRPKTH